MHASIMASTLSVFASIPLARANSRARRGFTRSAGSSALNGAASRSRWYDEVASYTTPTTSGPAQRTSARIPRPSFANRRDSPSRSRCPSRCSPETSTPMMFAL